MGRAAVAFYLGLGFLWGQGCACGAHCLVPSPPSIWPVAVREYVFGPSQTFGQDSRYFPYNVLGPVCTTATPTTPCADPCQIVSLGKGGYIVLTFDPPLADKPGPDFIVFENAFRYGNGQVFDEWMIVKVSPDGEVWYTFPYDSLTGRGLAGRTPTGCEGCPPGSINWQDPIQAGGDAYDLADVGLEWARYVRVEDATHFQTPDRLSADLDGVVAIHQLPPNNLTSPPAGDEEEVLVCWDLSGREVSRLSPASHGEVLILCLVRGKGGQLYSRRWMRMGH